MTYFCSLQGAMYKERMLPNAVFPIDDTSDSYQRVTLIRAAYAYSKYGKTVDFLNE